MKKLLLPFLLLYGLMQAQAQDFSVPDYTTSLSHAPGCSIDSTVVSSNSTLEQRIDYSYDSHRRMVLKDFRDIQMNQSEVSTFNYDVNDSVVKKTFASGQSAPTSTALTVMTRNSAKQVVYDTLSNNSGSNYIINYASSYTYDGSGYLVEIEKYAYSGSWAPITLRQFVRNSAGKETNNLFQGWTNSAWANTSQTNSTYNNNGDQTDHVLQYWNATTSAWKNISRERCAYTGSQLDTVTDYSWTNAWINSHRYTYSLPGAIDSVTLEYWNGTQWIGDTRHVRTWTQGKLTSLIEKGFTGIWQNTTKHEYLYDANGNHTITNIYGNTIPSDPLVLLTVTNHYYSCKTAGIAEHTLNDTKTYPVPSNSMLYFDSALPVKGGAVYTTGGLEAMHFQGASVDLSLMLPGVYYVKLLLEDGNFTVVKAVRE